MTKQISPLRQRMLHDMTMRNMSPNTKKVYTYAVANFAQYHRQSPDSAQSKVMRLAPAEFMRRFLLHVLPVGFHRIRHYGLFANGHRAEKLALCRRLLDVPMPSSGYEDEEGDADDLADEPREPPPCPCCGGRMKVVEVFDGPLSRPHHVPRFDSS